jgi:hypothetical protein
VADTNLQSLSAATPVATDEIEFLDKSDTAMSAGGSNKRAAISDVLTLYAGPLVGPLTFRQTGGTPGTDETVVEQTNDSFVVNNKDTGQLFPFALQRNGSTVFTISFVGEASFAGNVTGQGGELRLGLTQDVRLVRMAAGVVALTDNLGAGAVVELPQVAAGGTPGTNCGRLYAKDVAGNAEIFVKDEAGTETQVSPHSVDGPASLYDINDSLPHVVKEVNDYLGGVRYLNLSRACMLLEDLLKAIAAGQTLTNIRTFLNNRGPGFIDIYRTESFASHNTRLGLTGENALVVRDWSDDQDAKQAEYDAARETELIVHNQWVENGETGPEPTVRPIADIRKPVPTWLSSRGVTG